MDRSNSQSFITIIYHHQKCISQAHCLSSNPYSNIKSHFVTIWCFPYVTRQSNPQDYKSNIPFLSTKTTFLSGTLTVWLQLTKAGYFHQQQAKRDNYSNRLVNWANSMLWFQLTQWKLLWFWGHARLPEAQWAITEPTDRAADWLDTRMTDFAQSKLKSSKCLLDHCLTSAPIFFRGLH